MEDGVPVAALVCGPHAAAMAILLVLGRRRVFPVPGNDFVNWDDDRTSSRTFLPWPGLAPGPLGLDHLLVGVYQPLGWMILEVSMSSLV